jgi:nucleoside-diphosphate kinase
LVVHFKAIWLLTYRLCNIFKVIYWFKNLKLEPKNHPLNKSLRHIIQMSSASFFVMAKPDAIERRLLGEIISRFEKKGFQLKVLKTLEPEEFREIMNSHYKEHQGKSFYLKLIEFSVSGPICAMVWRGNIDVARQLVGATIPGEAKIGSIRGDYSSGLPNNLVHCSDSPENALRELSLWSKVLY